MTITKKLSQELFKVDKFKRWQAKKYYKTIFVILSMYCIALAIYIISILTYGAELPRPVAWFIYSVNNTSDDILFAFWPFNFNHVQVIAVLSTLFLFGILCIYIAVRKLPFEPEAPMRSSKNMRKRITFVFGNFGSLCVLFSVIGILTTYTLSFGLDTTTSTFEDTSNNVVVLFFSTVFKLVIDLQALLFTTLPIEIYEPEFLPYLALNLILTLLTSYFFYRKTIVNYPNPEIWYVTQVIETILELLGEKGIEESRRNEIQNRMSMMIYKSKKDGWNAKKRQREFERFIDSIIEYEPKFETQEDFFTMYAGKYGLKL